MNLIKQSIVAKIVFCIVMVIISILAINSINESKDKTICGHFFGGKNEEILSKLIHTDGETYVYDNYEISLISYLYDSATAKGYCIFTVKRTDDSKKGFDQFNASYTIRTSVKSSGSYLFDNEIYGNTEYLYYNFQFGQNVDDETGEIELYNTHDDSVIKKFALNSINKKYNKVFTLDNNVRLTVSPLCLYFEGQLFDDSSVTLVFGDDKKYLSLSDTYRKGIAGSGATITNSKTVSYYDFDELCDSEHLTSIIIDGTEYKPVK